MTASAALRAAWRTGAPVTPDMICADIGCLAELDGYQAGLRADGRLTADAQAAIARRRVELERMGRR